MSCSSLCAYANAAINAAPGPFSGRTILVWKKVCNVSLLSFTFFLSFMAFWHERAWKSDITLSIASPHSVPSLVDGQQCRHAISQSVRYTWAPMHMYMKIVYGGCCDLYVLTGTLTIGHAYKIAFWPLPKRPGARNNSCCSKGIENSMSMT